MPAVDIVVATVNVCVAVPEFIRPGVWRWVHAEESLIGAEAVYRADDLESVLLAYGAVVARATYVRPFPRFRLLARGLGAQRRVVGEYHYEWHAKARRFVPAGPPVVLWPTLEELPPELRAIAMGPHAASQSPWWERTPPT